jgi:hypothetical protein
MKSLLLLIICFSIFSSCIHPKVGIRKSRLVDPMMDPAGSQGLGDSLPASVQGQFEKAVVGGGGAGGGSCPTCK